MIEMIHGETIIKVRPSKVDEMLRKGWALAEEPQEVIAVETKVVEKPDDLDDITEDSEEE
jgi:hypothetical protein